MPEHVQGEALELARLHHQPPVFDGEPSHVRLVPVAVRETVFAVLFGGRNVVAVWLQTCPFVGSLGPFWPVAATAWQIVTCYRSADYAHTSG